MDYGNFGDRAEQEEGIKIKIKFPNIEEDPKINPHMTDMNEGQ